MAYKDLLNCRRCEHVHISGKPCRAPARRNRPFCLFHESAHLPVGDRPALPIPEDEHAFAISVTRILRALTEGDMEPKRAAVALYGLQLISGNLKRFTLARADVEDPERAIDNGVYARILVHQRHHNSAIPGDEQVAAFEREAREQYERQFRADPDIFNDPAIDRAQAEQERLAQADALLAAARAGLSPVDLSAPMRPQGAEPDTQHRLRENAPHQARIDAKRTT